MDAKGGHQNRWSEYVAATAERPPWELYRQVLGRFRSPGTAIDIGCGSGIETLDLLQRGWRVVAIDGEAVAVERLQEKVPKEQRRRLRTEVVSFEDMELPSSDLIWAGLSLPFCPSGDFRRVWGKVVSSLKAGGWFGGHLFGVRHGFSPSESMTFHERAEVQALCADLRLEYLVEEEGSRLTALDGYQHWHQYGIVAQKPG